MDNKEIRKKLIELRNTIEDYLDSMDIDSAEKPKAEKTKAEKPEEKEKE